GGLAASSGLARTALAVLAEGEVRGTYAKILLPNYGVFDERRYFEPGGSPALIEVSGVPVGLTICEDIWFAGPPATAEALAGARLIVNSSASPYHRGKGTERERDVVAARALETETRVALCNAAGGQDELVFDGHSVVVDEHGETLARAAQFEEELLVCDLELPDLGATAGRSADELPARMEAPILASVDVPPP